MSMFKVNVTPTRQQNIKKRDEAREPTLVIFSLFTPKSIVTFDGIPVTKTARRFLTLQNPSEFDLQIRVTKTLKPELNVQLEWTHNTILSCSEISMEIIWNPLKTLTCLEKLELTDDRGCRKDVSVVLKSIDKNTGIKLTRRPSTQQSVGNLSKKNLKTPSPKKFLKRKSPSIVRRKIHTTAITPNKWKQNDRIDEIIIDVKRAKQIQTHQFYENKTNFEERSDIFETLEFSKNEVMMSSNFEQFENKENSCPNTPNASAIFDKIQFTPATETKSRSTSNLEYLASLPTPVSVMRCGTIFKSPNDVNLKGRRIFTSPDDYSKRVLSPRKENINLLTPLPIKSYREIINGTEFEPNGCSTVSKSWEKLNFEKSLDSVRQIDNNELFSESNRKLFELSQNELYDSQNRIESLERLSSETYVKSPSCFDEIIVTEVVHIEKHEVITVVEEYRNELITIEYNEINQIATPPPLSMIAEENSNELGLTFVDKRNLEQTFHIGDSDYGTEACIRSDDNVLIDSIFPKTPLRKLTSESLHDLSHERLNLNQKYLKCNQGSMPNLHEIETINPIENNRYFNTNDNNDRADNVKLIFRENEICAQSSRFNLHDYSSIQTNSLFNLTEPKQSAEIENTSKGKNLPTDPRVTNLTNPSPMRQSKSEQFIRPKNVALMMSPPTNRSNHGSLYELQGEKKGSGQTIRTTKWGAVLPKKIKIPKVPIQHLILKKKIPTQKKAKTYDQEDERIILFDADLFLHGVINPDPFAATTTDDPFLAATMYLDERAIEQHETQFKKWLNALVTIPDEQIETNRKIDIGKLFQDVQNHKLTLAPTRETVSTNYFTKYRMISLRKIAMQLFHSEQLRLPLSKLAALVEKKMIAIREDRDLHRDLVLQRNILEILLSFNPLWLRIGLEVVFGELIPLQSNSDIIGLSSFIINRLFRDRYLENKNTRNFIQSEAYSEQIKIFTLKKLLFLLLFLDAAKTNKIIKHNPCLFVKNSQFKETKDVLLKITSTLVANFGDITKYLKRLGYVLHHKQTYLDEFDYAFKNISVDLRDGIRLTRVIEIILLRDDMSKYLRVPAISRLQRVHNVDIGLKALAEANFIINGDITAKDIADGHREKTLSLLWQIIYKFRAPKFKAAATVIQQWWRKSWLFVIIQRRIREKEEIKRNLAAIKIQSIVRGFLTRKLTKEYKTILIRSTIIIQKYIKRYQAQYRYNQIKMSTVTIQHWYRRTIILRETRQQFLTMKNTVLYLQRWYRRILLARKLEAASPLIRQLKENSKNRYDKAVILQRTIKSFILRKRFKETVYGIIRFNRRRDLKYRSATKIQSFYKMWKCRKEFLEIKKYCIIIQRQWKTVQAEKEFLQLKKKSIVIQRYFRNYLLMKNERKQFLLIKKSVVLIQQRFIAKIQMDADRNLFLRLKAASIKIQKLFRANQEMKEKRQYYLLMKKSTINMQQRFRANKLKRIDQCNYLLLQNAVAFIQILFRANNLMKVEQKKYIRIKESVRIIQERYRAFCLMRLENDRYKQLKKAAIILQQRYRAKQLMEIQRQKFLTERLSIIFIQNKFRANRKMKLQKLDYLRLKLATLTLQEHFRAKLDMKRDRNIYLDLKSKVICLQQRFRANCLAKKIQKIYERKKEATLTIQTRFRANMLMKEQRKNYINLKLATLNIQRRFRSRIQMKGCHNEFILMRKSVVYIQNSVRAYLIMKQVRSSYIELRQTTITIQRKMRAILLMRTVRQGFIKLKTVTTTIQQRFRANKLMKIQRDEYLEMRSKTVVIQQKLRATLMMRQQRKSYIELRTSTITIQRRFIALLCMRKQRKEYLLQRKSAIKIQAFYRGIKERKNYLILKESATKIQRKLRALHMMRKKRLEYQNLRSASTAIQQMFRAKIAMEKQRNNYLALRKNVMTIQLHFRAYLLKRLIQSQFIQYRKSVVCIQHHYRAILAMRTTRQQFIQLKTVTTTIQQRFRANKLMKIQRDEYLEMRNKTVIIQQKLRATLMMRQQRKSYIELRTSTITIQRRFIALLCMRKQRKEYLLQRKSAIKIQAFYRGIKERKNYLILKESATKIQRKLRALHMMRKKRLEYQNLRSASTAIQQRFRAKIAMEKQRKNYLALRKNVMTIQLHFRAYLLKRLIQSQFIQYRKSVACIQHHYRAILAMRTTRQQFIQLKTVTTTIQQRFRANQLMKTQRQEYLELRSKTVTIQQRLRATLIMRQECKSYSELRTSTIIIQRRFMALICMRKQRSEYLLQRQSAIRIQSLYRATKERENYINLKNSVTKIQRQLRATLLMRQEKLKYEELRKRTIFIQRTFRAIILMKQKRNEFLILQKNVINIQRRYRAQLLMRKVRNQYLLIRCLVICVQQKFRAQRLMNIERTDYLCLRKTTIFIQQKYRGKFLMQKERQKFLELREFIVKLQTRIRGTLSRQNYQKIRAIKLTPEILELRRKQKAARKIQAFWRGYCVRKRLTKNLKKICQNVMKLKNTDKTSTLAYKLKFSLNFLKGKFYIPDAISVLTKLDNMSRVVPHILIDDSHFIAKFCYTIMSQAIRSEPDKQLIELCSRIILNLARFNQTCDFVFQEEGLVTIAQMLLRWCDKDCGIFTTLCTLIWVFSHNPDKNKKIREFMTNHEAIYFLRETKKLVIRKDKMRKNDKRPVLGNLITHSSQLLPTLEPDYGIKIKQPYVFSSPIKGFNNSLNKLNISI